MNRNIPTVSDLVGSIKRNLEGSFRNVTVVGEITNLSLSSAGHWYLSLSDPNSLIGAAVFRMDAARNPVIKTLKDGDKVMCAGSISVYPKRGSFQLIIKRITPIGKGDLKDQFEKLKSKLSAEGLFDLGHKVKVPDMPKRIAVITARRGAALQDFLNIIKRRAHFCDVVVVPAVVQGDAAPGSLRRALEAVIKVHMQAKQSGDDTKCFDVVVLTRGGGSLEDLWAFNDEALAWDIYNCPIPTISAVGHQVDFSISDYVADQRCETPSAAAEVITNGQKAIFDRLLSNRKHLVNSMANILNKKKNSLNFRSPRKNLERIWSRVSVLRNRLQRLDLLQRKTELIPYQQQQYELDMMMESMKSTVNKLMTKNVSVLEGQYGLLKAMNPKNVLSRGYAYTQVDGKVISSAKEFSKLNSNDELVLHYFDGEGEVVKK